MSCTENETTLNELHFCGNTEEVNLDQRRRWMNRDSDNPITFWFMGGMKRIPTPKIKQVIQEAANKWAAICDLSFREANGSRDADLLIITKHLDGPGGTLADQQLPRGDNRQLLMRLDNERFIISDQPNTGSNVDLRRVVLHELGHGIGIGHLSSGNVLQPSYGRYVELQKDDIEAAQFLYGKKPTTDPDPNPDPDPDPNLDPDPDDIVIHIPANWIAGAVITISQKNKK
jgi:hypothetical protein